MQRDLVKSFGNTDIIRDFPGLDGRAIPPLPQFSKMSPHPKHKPRYSEKMDIGFVNFCVKPI